MILKTLVPAPAHVKALAASPARTRHFAAIDQGSSSTKMLVVSIDARGRSKVLVDRKVSTSLGKDVANGGVLPTQNIEFGLAALRALLPDAAKYGIAPGKISMIATAVVRNSSNGDAMMAQVKNLGLTQARVLSGAEEANAGYAGAVAAITAKYAKLATLDLGGGSFQLAIGTGMKLEKGGSTQIGSNFIIGNLLPAGLLDAAAFARADTELAKVAHMPLDVNLIKGRTLVATGGISKFLRAQFGKDVITRTEVDQLRRRVGAMAPSSRGAFLQQGKTPGVLEALGIKDDAGANDYGIKLPASSTLLIRIIDGLGVKEVRVSSTDARHAMIRDVASN